MLSSTDVEELRHADRARIRSWAEVTAVGRAFAVLAAYDLGSRIGGLTWLFASLTKVLPTVGLPETDWPTAVRTVSVAMNRARILYFGRPSCLRRTAALVHLLRREGVPAGLVVGVRRLPFAAHAWAEVAGVVINDFAAVQTQFVVIMRW